MRRRQPPAALVAPPLENEASGFGAHPDAKPVVLRTTTVVGLKGSFHAAASLFEWNRKLGRIPVSRAPVKANRDPTASASGRSRGFSRRPRPRDAGHVMKYFKDGRTRGRRGSPKARSMSPLRGVFHRSREFSTKSVENLLISPVTSAEKRAFRGRHAISRHREAFIAVPQPLRVADDRRLRTAVVFHFLRADRPQRRPQPR